MSESDQVARITDLFPDIIIFEILTHLPSKDACRFKSVSKRSNALISHHHFLSTYLSRNPPSSWVPLDRLIKISDSSPFPTHLPLLPQDDIVHTLSINPTLILKPNEPIPSQRTATPFPAYILHSNSGLILFAVNILPNPPNEKLSPAPLRCWMASHHVKVCGYDFSEDLLFVMNPVTKQWARLPNNPYFTGGIKTLHNCSYVLVACGVTGEFVVGMYAPFDWNPTLTCYSSKTGEWVRKKANYPLGSRDWIPFIVFELDGKMYWVDIGIGLIKWEVDDVFTAAATKENAKCVFIPLPSGKEREESMLEVIKRSRYVGPGKGRCILYFEIIEEGDIGLEVWRLADKDKNKEWELMYQVSKSNIERGLGNVFDANVLPSVLFCDPIDPETAILLTNHGNGLITNEECIVPLNARTQMVGTIHSFVGHSIAMGLVLPSWPTPLPPRLYAEHLKEQGNGYFKDQDFTEAIKSYSKSIGLSPTATAYANRAVAYLKVSKFDEAEDDCTKALNLDSGHCKVYVCRALARKELNNLNGALEDIKHALSLDPDSKELKKWLAEIKSLHEKASAAGVDG